MARRSDRRRRPATAPRGGSGKTSERARRSSPGAPGVRPARLLAWLEEHPRAALGSLGRLWRNPVASGLTIAVIAVALALPGALWMLLDNAQRATGGWDRGARISVYMEPGIAPERVERAAEAVARQDGIRVIQRISADEALADFRSLAGFEEALAALERNPLPAVVVIEPEDVGSQNAASLSAITEQVGTIDGVDRVQLDLEWVERLYALLDLVERGVAVIAVLLGAGVLLIVGNTIRLDILNRRDEIEVTKLIGASDAFIRRPFLYGGLWYGLGGGLAAWVLLTVARGVLAGPAARLAAAYGSSFRLEGLGAGESGLLVLAGAGLGLLGSWLAVGRHLRAIEPG